MDDAEYQKLAINTIQTCGFDALSAVREKVAQLEVLFELFLEKGSIFPAVLVEQYE